MKLRNKKTGEVIDLEQWRLEYYKDSGCITITNDKNQNEQFCYRAFADMKDEWEDYGPLINDEPTAKFVRAWMKHWGIEKVRARMLMSHGVELIGWKDDSRGREIDIQAAFVSGEIKDGHEYTIDELCGEDDE